jgi:UDP-glucose 4-epimerase
VLRVLHNKNASSRLHDARDGKKESVHEHSIDLVEVAYFYNMFNVVAVLHALRQLSFSCNYTTSFSSTAALYGVLHRSLFVRNSSLLEARLIYLGKALLLPNHPLKILA